MLENNLLITIIVIILVIILIIYVIYLKSKYIKLKGLDGSNNYYLLLNKKHDKLARSTLEELNNYNIDLLEHLLKNYNNYGSDQQITIRRLLARYKPDVLSEVDPNNVLGMTSYTYNKGDSLHFCIRKQHNDEIIDIDILKFVSTHELTHIGISEYQHPPIFWKTFKWLLLEAENAGLYVSPNFSKIGGIRYCGLNVTHNPRYDN